MGHNPSTRDDKKSEKKAAESLRTPEERLAAIRGSVVAKLYIIPDDIRFLLGAYDELLVVAEKQTQAIQIATSTIAVQDSDIVALKAEIETFKAAAKQGVILSPAPELAEGCKRLRYREDNVRPHEIDRFHDDGGAVHPEA